MRWTGLNRSINLTGAAVLAAALGVAGCSNSTKPSLITAEADPVQTSSIEDTPSIAKMAEAANAWREKPQSIRRAVIYARMLDRHGNRRELLNVLETTLRHNPEDAKLMAYYGKELVLAGRASHGIQQLQKAVKAGETNWKVYSALGSAYDQTGQHEKAREAYNRALAGNPQQVSIHNNIGMSYILEGDLKRAEDSLRQAQKLPDGEFNQTLRQNLALAVGLQGRFEEARDIASRDLPPQQVEQNMAFLKKMLNQNDTWQQIQGARQPRTSG